MSTIPGLERPAPVPNELTKPFWDACNERRLVLQNCTRLREAALSTRPALQQVWLRGQSGVEGSRRQGPY